MREALKKIQLIFSSEFCSRKFGGGNPEATKGGDYKHLKKLCCCRHYMDIVLIAVVVLCTVENDVIHAAYLAIALLLFRRRDALRYEGNKWFKWLPIYNFAVMLITLIYQAPWPSLWDGSSKPRPMKV